MNFSLPILVSFLKNKILHLNFGGCFLIGLIWVILSLSLKKKKKICSASFAIIIIICVKFFRIHAWLNCIPSIILDTLIAYGLNFWIRMNSSKSTLGLSNQLLWDKLISKWLQSNLITTPKSCIFIDPHQQLRISYIISIGSDLSHLPH